MSIIAYTYEADYHCIDCTVEKYHYSKQPWIDWRFEIPHPASDTNGIHVGQQDSEGNLVHPLRAWDEWQELACGDSQTKKQEATKMAKQDRVQGTSAMNELLNEYVAMIQEKVNTYWDRNGFTLSPDTITVEMGKKNAKIVSVQTGLSTGKGGHWPRCFESSRVQEGIRRSVHSFVNMETGDILKAGSWKAPAVNGVRGNISADDRGASVVSHHGTKYLR